MRKITLLIMTAFTIILLPLKRLLHYGQQRMSMHQNFLKFMTRMQLLLMGTTIPILFMGTTIFTMRILMGVTGNMRLLILFHWWGRLPL